MSRLYGLVAVLFLVAAPLRFAWCLWFDLQHPEVWDHDFTRDPRLYVPMMAAALMVLAVCVWRRGRNRKD